MKYQVWWASHVKEKRQGEEERLRRRRGEGGGVRSEEEEVRSEKEKRDGSCFSIRAIGGGLGVPGISEVERCFGHGVPGRTAIAGANQRARQHLFSVSPPRSLWLCHEKR